MKRIAPFQLDIRDTVFEHGRIHYCAISATLCSHLLTGETLLPFTYFEQIAAYQQDGINLDFGMPKPLGEYLVTGSFHAPGGRPVATSEVEISVGESRKKLLVFGERHWQDGLATPPVPLTSVSLGYSSAFGAKTLPTNPVGLGYEDGSLPFLENPEQRIVKAGQQVVPAALGVVGLDWPQRSRFLGTYDGRYMQQYFPGHPPDFDWQHFLAAAEDQRIPGFWRGDEGFRLVNMHPEQPVLEGRLPGLTPRCFLQHTLRSPEPVFGELPLHLDTLWFFPEQLLVLQIWRGVLEVNDDEASAIHHVLAGYEESGQPGRDPHYYRQAFEKRLHGTDPLRNSLTTADLVPPGHPSAMELLQTMAMADSKPSALANNIAAKEASLREQVDARLQEAMDRAKEQIAGVDLPGQPPIDLDQLIEQAKNQPPDPDQVALSNRLEALLPGITQGNAQAIDLKDFSFEKIDEMIQAVQDFSQTKEQQAKAMAREEIAKAMTDIRRQLDPQQTGGSELPPEARGQLQQQLTQLAAIDLDHPPPSPLPRVDAEEILDQLGPIDPMIQEAMQHMQSLQAIGVDNETSRALKEHIDASYTSRKTELEERLRQTQRDFKEVYMLGAHFMARGASPHAVDLDRLRQRFFQAVAAGEDLRERDWACLDLGGARLDGIDLNGCFLEQVDFTGASLKGANLSGAILARAVLDDADLSNANLSGANIGAVSARRTRFRAADLSGAKLSRGNFTAADFTEANLAEIESLEIEVGEAVFDRARLLQIKLIRQQFGKTSFQEAEMEAALFFECTATDCNFSQARLARSVWADTSLRDCRFAGADLGSACFVATEEGRATLENVHFPDACLERATLQNLRLPHCDLSGSRLSGALFNGCDLSGANLVGAQATQAQFRKANLNGADLRKIDLREGSLAKAQLTNANFAGANLFAVDLLRCSLGKTDFGGANLDATILEQGDGQ